MECEEQIKRNVSGRFADYKCNRDWNQGNVIHTKGTEGVEQKDMRIIVADDEKLVLERLVSIIREVKPDAEIYDFVEPEELLEFAKDNPCDVAFLDLEMGTMSGLDVAKQLKLWNPKVNIIFVTAYDQYILSAYKLRASGYLMKPVDKADIVEELENLRNPFIPEPGKKLVITCFGNFEAFVNGEILSFERSKTKELLAYLVDRKGSSATSGELRAILWEGVATDEKNGNYLQKLKRDLVTTLENAGVANVLHLGWNKYAIRPELISCDYYDFLDNKPEGIRAYNGEYMSQYSWAVLDCGLLVTTKKRTNKA